MRVPLLLVAAAALAWPAQLPARDKPLGHGKFIQTFTVKLRGGEKLRLIASVTNRGARPIYRLLGLLYIRSLVHQGRHE